jgi:hypothetical protein
MKIPTPPHATLHLHPRDQSIESSLVVLISQLQLSLHGIARLCDTDLDESDGSGLDDVNSMQAAKHMKTHLLTEALTADVQSPRVALAQSTSPYRVTIICADF